MLIVIVKTKEKFSWNEASLKLTDLFYKAASENQLLRVKTISPWVHVTDPESNNLCPTDFCVPLRRLGGHKVQVYGTGAFQRGNLL